MLSNAPKEATDMFTHFEYNAIRYGIRKIDPCINKVLELENIQ